MMQIKMGFVKDWSWITNLKKAPNKFFFNLKKKKKEKKKRKN